ncbi:serine/arginine repetitive matrix protein 1-like isoform X2 [Leptopilina heterotoma]|uniref:serine/arginine repetitive matrix protein 1-like isoform X2 n=1 Tax=Leptopilina heterotoma TaxID=63436 RepID=UPI001CA86341|nr:serine/arginine repetitive matrix protein 1-like isoform X2 [Leptopilina heterotoma]
MDYHKKTVSAPSHKCKNEDDEDDLEALRLAALQTLRVKDTLQKKRHSPHQSHGGAFQGTQSLRSYYKQARDHFHHRQQRQNGVRHNYFPKNTYRNPNLIEIVPQGEVNATSVSKENIDTGVNQTSSDGSKFQRYDDNASGSEDDEVKDIDVKVEVKAEEIESTEVDENVADRESESGLNECLSERTAEEADEDRLLNDDDDDVLLMADLEEEDSLERLMDEMEREIKDDKIEITEKKVTKKEKVALKKVRDDSRKLETKVKLKVEVPKVKEEVVKEKVDIPVAPKAAKPEVKEVVAKPEPRPLSPRTTNIRRRSVSPKPRPWRKVSPRRSPRRSPLRLLKKPLREISRYRSPRKSPTRYSPRSPKISPRQKSPRNSPQRSPDRRSPLMSRAMSPRNRSPRPTRSLSRSPRMWSRSSRSRSRTPRRLSPRRLRSPRYSPHRYSPRPKIRVSRSRSPRSPRRRISRSRSPRSPRRGSPRLRSPRMSPRRLSPRYRSPRGSPRRSPWSSPRRSPRLSPKRLKSPRWSPKDCTRKSRVKSASPEKRGNSPLKKNLTDEKKTSELDKPKPKKETLPQKSQPEVKEEQILDPILEARKRKFESITPIDPINANKTIKLSNKKEESKKLTLKQPEVKEVDVKKIIVKRTEPTEPMEESVEKRRRKVITLEPKDEEEDLLPEEIYDSESIEEETNEEVEEKIQNVEEVCLEVHPINQEKKKKKDKEIYQVGKLKDLSIAERISKEKKLKKRKVETVISGTSEIETDLEDVTIDEEGDLRTELSRRRAERLNRAVPIQSARLLQSAFKGVVNEVAKNNAKVNQRFALKGTEKPTQKEVRRVTVLHRTLSDLHDSEEEVPLEAKVPVRLRLGVNKVLQETRETKISRKASKKQGRKPKLFYQ